MKGKFKRRGRLAYSHIQKGSRTVKREGHTKEKTQTVDLQE